MKREIKLSLIKEFNDIVGDQWVECEDENKHRWILSKMAYETFKSVGLPMTPKNINDKIQAILGGKNYASMSTKDRHKTLIETLEAFTGIPIENLLPKLGELNV